MRRVFKQGKAYSEEAVSSHLKQDPGQQEAQHPLLQVVFGHDHFDLDAFGALGGCGITVAVAPEGPTAAAYSLRDPTEVLDFLRWLAAGEAARQAAQTVPIS